MPTGTLDTHVASPRSGGWVFLRWPHLRVYSLQGGLTAEDRCKSPPAMLHCRHGWDQRPRVALDSQLPILILWQTLPLSLTEKTLGSGWPVGVLIPTPGYMGAGGLLVLGGEGSHGSAIFKVPAAAGTPGPLHVPVLGALVGHCKPSNCKFL